VLAFDDGAVLLERATGSRSLVRLAEDGQDDDATRIICDVARRLHAPRKAPPPGLVPLTTWFEALAPAARAQGGILVHAANAAANVLGSQREIVPSMPTCITKTSWILESGAGWPSIRSV